MKLLNSILSLLSFFGINLRQSFINIGGLAWFINDYFSFKKDIKNKNEFPFGKWYPILHEKKSLGGVASGQYFHQDLLVAQKIFKKKPIKHVDVASRVDGFVAHVAVFREIEIIDIRKVESSIPNIKFIRIDMMRDDLELQDYTDSISCLHAIEHFGLGRYNDPIDSQGHIKGIVNIYKMLKKSGIFYLSAPIGPQRIEFNAHRVFSLLYLLDLLKDRFDIVSFSYVDDKGFLYENVSLSENIIHSNAGCWYGCGIFELIKK